MVLCGMTVLSFHAPLFSISSSDSHLKLSPSLFRHTFVPLPIRFPLRRTCAHHLAVSASVPSMTYEHGLPGFMGDATTSFHTLYPRIEPFFVGELVVSDLHTVYYELSGNPNGLPVLFVHGGPGGGTEPAHRRFFDPKDQRGCGRSQPFACTEENTTWDLIGDMERVREAAKIKRWILFGGSWGSTLSVAYAQQYPERVIGLILRGIFLGRERELRWLYEREGAAMLYPEAFQRYIEGLPPTLRNSESLLLAYHHVLSRKDDGEERRTAANAWSIWEHTLSSFPRGNVKEDEIFDYGEEENLAFARIENHYFINNCFFGSDGYLLKEEQMSKIRNIKTYIVQGRWDMVCPRKSAYDLATMFEPRCVKSVIVENAGHSTFEPGIEQALLRASDEFGREFGWMATKGANG